MTDAAPLARLSALLQGCALLPAPDWTTAEGTHSTAHVTIQAGEPGQNAAMAELFEFLKEVKEAAR